MALPLFLSEYMNIKYIAACVVKYLRMQLGCKCSTSAAIIQNSVMDTVLLITTHYEMTIQCMGVLQGKAWCTNAYPRTLGTLLPIVGLLKVVGAQHSE